MTTTFVCCSCWLRRQLLTLGIAQASLPLLSLLQGTWYCHKFSLNPLPLRQFQKFLRFFVKDVSGQRCSKKGQKNKTSVYMDHGSVLCVAKRASSSATDHFSALKIWMFENKFVSLPSHLKTIEPMEVHRGAGTMWNTETSKMIRRTDPMIP